MHVIRKKGWELPESVATDESVFLRRRELVKAMGLAPAFLAASSLPGFAAADPAADPTADLYPVMQNLRYRLDRPVTDGRRPITIFMNSGPTSKFPAPRRR